VPPTGAALSDFVSQTRNPILQAAAPLLTLAARLASSVIQANVATLRAQAVHEIRTFEEKVRTGGVVAEDILVARYMLCTFVDSGVLNTPWGAQSDWAGQSLLVTFHKEVSGGEKFFQIIDRLTPNARRYIDLIELAYVCLAFGYEGKFRIDPQGAARVAELRSNLYRIIRENRSLTDEELSPNWRGVVDKRNPVIRYVPWWMVAAVGLAIAFVVFDQKLRARSTPVKEAMLQAPAVVYKTEAPPPHINKLKEVLAPQEQAGLLTVEEFGDKTVVTLSSAAELFRSGSARVNPDSYQTLRAIALALNQVTGRVAVVGHTDDQPLHSFQFVDNFDLSNERAYAVTEILKPVIDNPRRISYSGVGSTQPRYTPESTPDNRARNRRVEIIHSADAAPASAPAPAASAGGQQ
jgi:type VI secretion system protein ImpK